MEQNPLQQIMLSLSQPQRDAIAVIKLSLDCFNSRDGVGMFSGVERYNVLSARVGLVAVQSRDMHGFWAKLLSKMRWPLPPKKADANIVKSLIVSDPPATLRVLATETISIVTIARMLHDQDKSARFAGAQEEHIEPAKHVKNNAGIDDLKDDTEGVL